MKTANTGLLIGIFACFMGGCASGGGQPAAALADVPTKNAVFRKEMGPLVDCSLVKIDAILGPGSTKTDLPSLKQSKLALVSGGVKLYEATFERVNQGITSVRITAAQTMWGPYPATERVLASISACAPPS